MKNSSAITFRQILFVVSIDKAIALSHSPIFSTKELLVVNAGEISNSTGQQIKLGDKILVLEKLQTENPHMIIDQILARNQPIASSPDAYLKKLHVQVDCKGQHLDFQELNTILQSSLGIMIGEAHTDSMDYHILIRVVDPDLGTKICPFSLPLDKSSFPFEVNFPKVSCETKEYLQKVYPNNAKITDTRIFAFRLMHFLLHISGYLEHWSASSEEYETRKNAIEEGNPELVPQLDVNKLCLNDWQSAHFIAIDSDLSSRRAHINGMICKDCRKNRVSIVVGFEDLKSSLPNESQQHPKFKPLRHKLKDIFYILDVNKKGVILSYYPYLANKVFNIGNIDWSPVNELKWSLINIFVPGEMFSSAQVLRKRDKVMTEIDIELHSENRESGLRHQVKHIAAVAVLGRRVNMINPRSLTYRLKPFRLSIVLKIGPGIDHTYIQEVVKIVGHLTGWHVRIDKSSYPDLERCYGLLSQTFQDWKGSNQLDKGKLVAKMNGIIGGLARAKDVEDRFEVVVYVFPDKFRFVGDVFGNVFSGQAIHRTFAIVHTWPKTYRPNQGEPCEKCKTQRYYPFSETLTSLFVVHEIMHIASGLDDHHDCLVCTYNQSEMQPFRRLICEDCIRKKKNRAVANCLMSYHCIECIASRPSGQTLSDILCEECKRRLFPSEEFAVRQVARMNHLLYWEPLILKREPET